MAEKLKHSNDPVTKHRFWCALVIAVAGFLLYANTIANYYALDDGAVITTNAYVQQGLQGLGGIFTTGVWHFEANEPGYYRPLSLATFAIEKQIFGNNSHISHFTNVLFYAFTGFVLCILLMRIFKQYKPWFPVVISLLFIAHPMHTEVVANIKSRDEILAFLNLLFALLFLFRATKAGEIQWKWLIPACFFYYLALLSKETALAGIILVPVILHYTGALRIRQILKITLPLLLVLLAFQYQKFRVLGTLIGGGQNDIVSFPYANAGTSERLATSLLHLARYLKLCFIPYPLSYNYAYDQIPVAGWTSGGAIAGFTCLIILLLIIFISIDKKSPLSLGSFIFLVALLPALGFVFLKGGILAERFLYAPSLGFCMALAWVIFSVLKIPFKGEQPMSRNLTFKFMPFAVILVLYSFTTVSRNSQWKNDLSLVSHDVEISTNSCQVHLHDGKILIDLGVAEPGVSKKRDYFDRGIAQLRQALAINPHYARADFKMGYAFQSLEANTDSAIYYYNRTIDEAPGFAPAYNNLGALYNRSGKTLLAIQCLTKALELNPNLSDAARTLQSLKQQSIAGENDNCNAQAQDSFRFYSDAGIKYAQEKNFDQAQTYLNKAIALNPKSATALVNLAVCYGMMHDYTRCEATLKKALRLAPDNKTVLQNLAALYHAMGNTVKEKEYLDKLQDLGGP